MRHSLDAGADRAKASNPQLVEAWSAHGGLHASSAPHDFGIAGWPHQSANPSTTSTGTGGVAAMPTPAMASRPLTLLLLAQLVLVPAVLSAVSAESIRGGVVSIGHGDPIGRGSQ